MRFLNAAAFTAILTISLSVTESSAQGLSRSQSPTKPLSPALMFEKVNKRPVSTLERSIKEYEDLLSGSSWDPILMNNLAALYFISKRYYEAQSLLRKAVVKAPSSAPIRTNLAIVQNLVMNPGLAIETLEEVMKRDPHYDRAKLLLCDLYGQEKRMGDALTCYEAIHSSAKIGPVSAGNFAAALLNANEVDRAYKMLEKASLEYPKDAGIQNGLGVALFRKKKYSRAEAKLRHAVHLRPDAPEIRYNLAMAQMATNNRGAVMEQYKFLKNSDPKLAEQLYKLLFRDKIVNVNQDR